MSIYDNDPYYVSPKYEEGYEAGSLDRHNELKELVDLLTGVIDELGCRLADDDEEGHAMALAALNKAKEVL